MTKFERYGNIGMTVSNRIASDIYKKKNAQNYKFYDKKDMNVYNMGIDWYNSGLSLEDAPQEVRNNTNFINGFKKGQRLALVAELENKDIKHR